MCIIYCKDMESRCRLCGRKERQGTEKFKNIFDGEPGLSLDCKINKLLPIVVLQWDPLPHQICDICLEKLNDMDKFYEDTGNTNIFLKKLLPKNSQNREFKKTELMLKIPDLIRTYGNYLKDPPVDDQTVNSTNALVPDDFIPSDEEVTEEITQEVTPDLISEKRAEPVVIDLDKEEKERLLIEKKLDDFQIRKINDNPPTFIYTCRKCYKSLVAKHAAIAHVCEAEPPSNDSEETESWTRKKITLSTTFAGLLICKICQMQFTRKSALYTHLKQQHVKGSDDEDDSQLADEEKIKHMRSKIRKLKKERRKEKKLKKMRSKVTGKEWEEENNKRNDVNKEEEFLNRGTENEGNENVNKINVTDKEKSKERSLSRTNPAIEEEPSILSPVFKAMIVCTVCQEAFLSQKLLNDHQKTHNTEKGGTLGTSTLKSLNSQNLTNGEETIKEEKCGICDKVFCDTVSLQEHHGYHLKMSARVLHSSQLHLPKRKVQNEDFKIGVGKIEKNFCGNSNEEELYVCKTCDAHFNRRTSLESHEMTHIIDKSIYDFGDDDEQVHLKKRRKSNDCR